MSGLYIIVGILVVSVGGLIVVVEYQTRVIASINEILNKAAREGKL